MVRDEQAWLVPLVAYRRSSSSIHPDEQMNSTTYFAIVKRTWAEWSKWRPMAQ